MKAEEEAEEVSVMYRLRRPFGYVTDYQYVQFTNVVIGRYCNMYGLPLEEGLLCMKDSLHALAGPEHEDELEDELEDVRTVRTYHMVRTDGRTVHVCGGTRRTRTTEKANTETL